MVVLQRVHVSNTCLYELLELTNQAEQSPASSGSGWKATGLRESNPQMCADLSQIYTGSLTCWRISHVQFFTKQFYPQKAFGRISEPQVKTFCFAYSVYSHQARKRRATSDAQSFKRLGSGCWRDSQWIPPENGRKNLGKYSWKILRGCCLRECTWIYHCEIRVMKVLNQSQIREWHSEQFCEGNLNARFKPKLIGFDPL